MRKDILHILRSSMDCYVSGEELSTHLKVSRTAIWKHIQALKNIGYEIEGHTKIGYRLAEISDLLLPEEVKAAIDTSVLGREVYCWNEVASTNLTAHQLALEGCSDGTIVLAETQGQGRGRLQRSWYSPYGKGLWCSLILRPRFKPYDAPKTTLLTAVAIQQAIAQFCNISAGIKWPNDILFEGKKLCGILTEINADMDSINYIIVGFGLNVNISQGEFPSELSNSATSVSVVSGSNNISRIKLFAKILSNFEVLYKTANEIRFSNILETWRECSTTIGQLVEVRDGESIFKGKAIDIDEDGALLVSTCSGLQKVLAGDVAIRVKE